MFEYAPSRDYIEKSRKNEHRKKKPKNIFLKDYKVKIEFYWKFF